jgi:hypothetical protein
MAAWTIDSADWESRGSAARHGSTAPGAANAHKRAVASPIRREYTCPAGRFHGCSAHNKQVLTGPQHRDWSATPRQVRNTATGPPGLCVVGPPCAFSVGTPFPEA